MCNWCDVHNTDFVGLSSCQSAFVPFLSPSIHTRHNCIARTPYPVGQRQMRKPAEKIATQRARRKKQINKTIIAPFKIELSKIVCSASIVCVAEGTIISATHYRFANV